MLKRTATRKAREVRRFLAQRLRALRKEQGLSQEALGKRSDLSGKFIGEVERSEKSISVISLSRVAKALRVPLRLLTDIRPADQPLPNEEAEKVLALLAHRTPAELRRAHAVVRAVLPGRARRRGPTR